MIGNCRCVVALGLLALCARAESHTYHYTGPVQVEATAGAACAFVKVPTSKLDAFLSDSPRGAIDGYYVVTMGEDHPTVAPPTHVYGARHGALSIVFAREADPGKPRVSIDHLGRDSLTVTLVDQDPSAMAKGCWPTRTKSTLVRIDDASSAEKFNAMRQVFEVEQLSWSLGIAWQKRDLDAALRILNQILAMTDARNSAVKDYKWKTLMGMVLNQLALGSQEDLLAVFQQATTLSNPVWSARSAAISWVADRAKWLKVAPQLEALLRRALTEEAAAPAPNNLAAYQLTLGYLLLGNRNAEALDWFEKGIAQLPAEEPALLSAREGLGVALTSLGRYGEGFTQIQQALSIAERLNAPLESHLVLLVGISTLLGRFDMADPYSRPSCAVAEDNAWSNPDQYVTSCSVLTTVLFCEKKFEEAEPILRKLLGFVAAMGPKSVSHGRILALLGRNLIAQRKFDEAQQVLKESMSIMASNQVADTSELVVPLAALADIELHQGDIEAARQHYVRAYLIERADGAPTVWRSETNLMLYYRNRKVGQPALAIYYGKLAVNHLQAQRAGLSDPNSAAPDSDDTQTSFVNSVSFVYRGLANLLINAGRLGEAQQVMAMLREQELFNFTLRDATSDPRKTTLSLSVEERQATESEPQLISDLRELNALEAKASKGPVDPKIQERLAELERRTEDNLAIYAQKLDDLSRANAQGSGPSREKVEAMGMPFRETIKTLGHDSVMLQYLVLPDQLEIIMTTADAPVVRNVDVSRSLLYQQIEAYRETLQNPHADPLPQAQQLYGELIAPIVGDLKQLHAKVLMLSLDDALRYLPFAALHDGKQYLIENYALATVPLAATQQITAPARPDWKVWGLGVTEAHDVTFGDPDHPQQLHFAALSSVAPELNGIAGSSGILPGSVMLDSSFNRASLRQGLSGNYAVVHIASHFEFSPGDNTTSFLLLGDGPLSLAALRTTFDFGKIDLLTLSACETALGDTRKADGSEVESFSSVVLKQGTHAVLATLWSVADSSTALFMRTLYQARQKSHMTKAEALRTAQLSLLHGSNRGGSDAGKVRGFQEPGEDGAATRQFQADPNAPYAHPYFWAPFVLTGNWL